VAITVRNCGNCAFHLIVDDDNECHFYPPSVQPKYNESGYTSEWAKLENLEAWCGQWAADFLIQNKPGPVA